MKQNINTIIMKQNIKTIIIILLVVVFLLLKSYIEVQLPYNIIILNFAKMFFYIFVIMLIYLLYQYIFKKNRMNKFFYFFLSAFLLLSIPHIPIMFGYQTTQIGDFYEAKEYHEKYYVMMSKNPKTAAKRTVYKLSAEIERRYDYYGTSGENDIYILNYHINYLYFPNGGYLTFNYDHAFDFPELTKLQLNKEVKCTDDNDDIYYITLTTEKSK